MDRCIDGKLKTVCRSANGTNAYLTVRLVPDAPGGSAVVPVGYVAIFDVRVLVSILRLWVLATCFACLLSPRCRRIETRNRRTKTSAPSSTPPASRPSKFG